MWRALGLSALTVITTLGLSACSERSRTGRPVTEAWWQSGTPDEPPQMLNQMLPFQYPVAQYLRRMQGNVTLRLFVDAEGRVVPDSTRIERPSGISAFDSAALAGAAELRFRAARRRGVAVPVALLFPVHFRHPEVPATPADTSHDSLHPRS
jgi:TonB family protein